MSRQLHVGRDNSNIEIGGRGFDLELFQGRKKPSNLASAVRPFTVFQKNRHIQVLKILQRENLLNQKLALTRMADMAAN